MLVKIQLFVFGYNIFSITIYLLFRLIYRIYIVYLGLFIKIVFGHVCRS